MLLAQLELCVHQGSFCALRVVLPLFFIRLNLLMQTVDSKLQILEFTGVKLLPLPATSGVSGQRGAIPEATCLLIHDLTLSPKQSNKHNDECAVFYFD